MTAARHPAPFPSVIASIEELRGLVPPPSEMVCRKVINRLDEHCRSLISHAAFVALATSGASGDCDVSPRGERSGLWEPSRWPDRSDLPAIAQVLADHVRAPGLTADAIDLRLPENYKTTLY